MGRGLGLFASRVGVGGGRVCRVNHSGIRACRFVMVRSHGRRAPGLVLGVVLCCGVAWRGV